MHQNRLFSQTLFPHWHHRSINCSHKPFILLDKHENQRDWEERVFHVKHKFVRLDRLIWIILKNLLRSLCFSHNNYGSQTPWKIQVHDAGGGTRVTKVPQNVRRHHSFLQGLQWVTIGLAPAIMSEESCRSLKYAQFTSLLYIRGVEG